MNPTRTVPSPALRRRERRGGRGGGPPGGNGGAPPRRLPSPLSGGGVGGSVGVGPAGGTGRAFAGRLRFRFWGGGGGASVGGGEGVVLGGARRRGEGDLVRHALPPPVRRVLGGEAGDPQRLEIQRDLLHRDPLRDRGSVRQQPTLHRLGLGHERKFVSGQPNLIVSACAATVPLAACAGPTGKPSTRSPAGSSTSFFIVSIVPPLREWAPARGCV